MDLTFNSLKKCFKRAIDNNAEYVAVQIEMDGFDDAEVIINSRVNFADKLAYYKKTYDDSLQHKFAEGIRIIGFTYGDTFEEIQEELVG